MRARHLPLRWPSLGRSCLLASAIVFALGAAASGEASSPGASVEKGKAIYDAKCAACHTLGGGRTLGPDLKGITALRDTAWLARFIVAPGEMIAAQDPLALQLVREYNSFPMPNTGVSDADAADILAYLATTATGGSTQQGAGTTVPGQRPADAQPPAEGSSGQPSAERGAGLAAPAAQAVEGSPERGRTLFTGGRALENGGGACLGCHRFAAIAGLGGGMLGPDLTGSAGRLGAAGMDAALKGMPFPSMLPLYAGRPLTPQEQADLAAFLRSAGAGSAPDQALPFTLLGIVGLFATLALFGLLGRRRLRPVRRALTPPIVLQGRVGR